MPIPDRVHLSLKAHTIQGGFMQPNRARRRRQWCVPLTATGMIVLGLVWPGLSKAAPAGAVTAAPTAYVTNYSSNTVTPIDTATNTPGTPIPVGTTPTAVAITPDGTTAYVAELRL